MLRRLPCPSLWSCGLLLAFLCLGPRLSQAQTELINANVVVVGSVNLCIVTVGATDAYACNLGRTITAYQPWTRYSFIPNVANTGPAALALNGLTSLPIKKLVAGVKTDLATGDIAINQPVEVYYDGTEFVWTSSASGGGGVTPDTLGRAAFYNATTTVDGAPGLTFTSDGTTVTTVVYRRTARSATATLDTTDGPVIECSAPSANVELTLPAVAGTQTWFHVIKADATAFTCLVKPASGERINATVNGTLTLTNQWEAVDLYVSNTATPNWHGVQSLVSTRRSVYIPAGGMDVSGGCTATAAAALLTNGPKLPTIACTDADADSIEFDWVMPDGWDGGTITVELAAFSIGNNNTEVFEMDFAGQCVSSGDTPTAHSTTGEQPATITWGNAANREQHATTAAITVQGTCAAGDHVYMRGQVDATVTTMTPMTDLKLLGVKIEYVRTTPSD